MNWTPEQLKEAEQRTAFEGDLWDLRIVQAGLWQRHLPGLLQTQKTSGFGKVSE